jgi:outer membrane receptor protein involved in Fe transport
MSKKILLIAILLAIVPFFAFGQSSGKIIGVAKDANNGELLPGVNISLEGTTFGAASDVDGYYVILNVPVGVYDVRASFIGYKDVVLKGIRVSAGVTVEANYSLEETAIEGQAVVVTAQRPLVEKHLTQQVNLVTSEEIENIPVRGFQSLIATQNSVIVQDDNIYIRGGRTDEVGYYIDGAYSSNPLNNTQAVYVIQEAVEEFQVLVGGYNAEFGGANSGLVRSELKTGGSKYNISLDFQTDKFASEGSKFLGTYSYRDHYFVGTIGGPLIPGSQKVRAFVAYENHFQGDSQKRYNYGYFFPGLIDSRSGSLTGDVKDVSWMNGYTIHQERDSHALNGTLLFDLSPIKLRATGSYSWLDQQIDDRPMLRSLNDRLQTDQTNTGLFALKGTYVVNPTSFVEASVNYFTSTLDRKDDYFGNNWELWFDSAAVANHTRDKFGDEGMVTYRDAYNPELDYLFYGFSFDRQGDPRDYYRIEKNQYIGGTLDFVSQMGRHHEVKLGGDIRQHTIRHFDITPSVVDLKSSYNTDNILDIPAATFGASGRVNAYGYDNYGKEISSDISVGDSIFYFGPKKPIFAALYLQDKIEFNDLIINAGVRFDYYDTKDQRLKDPTNAPVHPTTGYLLPEAWEKVDAFTQFSPRLGFSFPVSDRTVFYAQYGKFIQMPKLNNMYFGSADYRDQLFTGGNFFLAPIGFGLEPIRTTSYEIGFRQQISSVAAFDITGFYKNVKGQPTLERVDADPNGDLGAYNRYVNGDFATTQGLEFKLQLRRTNRLQAQLNYTLTSSEGTGSTETAYLAAIEQSQPAPTVINPLDFAQAHVGSIILDYRFGKNDGGPVLEQLGANLLFNFSSGHPFTTVDIAGLGQVSPYNAGVDYMQDTRSRVAKEPLGSSTTPWNFNLDLRLDKTFQVLESLSATVYMRVNNVLNTKNVRNVYQLTGNADDDGFISNPELSGSFVNSPTNGETYVALYHAINTKNGQAYWDNLPGNASETGGLQLWANPRQIFFGIKLNY